MLPDEERLPFLNESYEFLSDNVINNGFNLATVIIELPIQDRLTFAKNYFGEINDESEMSVILNLIPEEEILKYIDAQIAMIEGGSPLVDVLLTLPINFRLKIAAMYFDKIQNGNELSDVLSTLPRQDRLEFAKPNAHKIHNSAEFDKVSLRLKSKSDESVLLSLALRGFIERMPNVLQSDNEMQGFLDLIRIQLDNLDNQKAIGVVKMREIISSNDPLQSKLEKIHNVAKQRKETSHVRTETNREGSFWKLQTTRSESAQAFYEILSDQRLSQSELQKQSKNRRD